MRNSALNANVVRRVSAREGHALWAPTYDREPNPLLALEERILEPLLPDLHGKFVLDVACGTGRWLRKLLGRGARGGAGVDLSLEMLALAAVKIPPRGRLVCADGLALPIANGSADLTLCSFGASYIPDVKTLARELWRVSRSRASVVVSDFHPSGYSRGWRRAFRMGDEVIEISSFPRTIEQICAEFESQGFEFLTRLEPCLDEPERPLFERSGKTHLYKLARQGPAIYICHFRRAVG